MDKLESMFGKGSSAISNYNGKKLKQSDAYKNLKDTLKADKSFDIANTIGEPFDFTNGRIMQYGDFALISFHGARTYWAARKAKGMKITYHGGEPTLWKKYKGEYKFSVGAPEAWTAKGGHSAELATKFREKLKSTRFIDKPFKKLYSTYNDAGSYIKHQFGFPKNQSNYIDGKKFKADYINKVKFGTKEVVETAAKAKGFTKVAERVPGVGNTITVVANLTEFVKPENKNKSKYEKFGRFLAGTATDFALIGAGTKIGATIGSVGGPIGIVIGGAAGGLIGAGISTFGGDKIKDFGGSIGKKVGKSISKWFK